MWWRRQGKVFGIGLSRTGTTSLNSALELLGLRSDHFPCDSQTQHEIRGFLASPGERLRLSVLEHYDALTDAPVCATFEALDAAYPRSRFVLTVRDRHEWLSSCETYWRQGIEPFLRDHPDNPLSGYMAAMSRALYGSAGFNSNGFLRAYDAYHARVARHFRGREHDVLTMDVTSGQGWAELCAFLDRPVPDRAFPFENPFPIENP